MFGIAPYGRRAKTGGGVKHGVVLGDPAHFRIKGGQNPYTRNRLGFRKRVDRKKARDQWLRFRETLERLGARVFVLPARPEYPGMVFPANAGFLHPKYAAAPPREKRFYLSNLAGHRAGESEIYRSFFSELGYETRTLPYPFEGEADFFPCGPLHLFCYGRIVPTGFRPAWGLPPWRYRFSHRTDYRCVTSLGKVVPPDSIVELELASTRYYHGDTCLFAFGPERGHLFAYLQALGRESQLELKRRFGRKLHPLSKADAEAFAANGFQMDTPEGPHVLLPQGVSRDVTDRVAALGLGCTTVDVSEFFRKGGGSIKCLLCDLGPVEG
jgi:N-dimethylarginine dimethylaminohydrolase